MKLYYLPNQDKGVLGLHNLNVPKDHQSIHNDSIRNLPDTPDYWETITVPAKIERILLQRNQHHFSQAEGTPFTEPSLRADVGYKANGYAVDLILSGKYHYQGSLQATTLLIKHLQTKTAMRLTGTITKEEVLGKLRTWKESTTEFTFVTTIAPGETDEFLPTTHT
ncbi:hypothetical protein G9A89_021676, partial [Geosiphon pyriformis]